MLIRSKAFLKEDILRSYLNAAPYGKNNRGENIVGIKTAAQGIFAGLFWT